MSDVHCLPASWYSSSQIFDLEMRSVFHKAWIFTTHASRFQNPGDYFTYNVAGVEFILIKDHTGQINGYHNVCGLKQEPSFTKEIRGNTPFYWSNDTPDNITNASGSNSFDTSAALKMVQNDQYKIHTRTTDQGLVYVNFDNSPNGPMAFENWYQNMEETMKIFDFSQYEYHKSYTLDGNFNWKTLVDGYQECYHCPTAHPGLSKAFALPTYKVVPQTGWCRHFAKSKNSQEIENSKDAPSADIAEFDGLWMYMFPANGVNCYSPAWYSLRVLPVSSNRTLLLYDIYRKKADPSKVKDFVDFMQQLNVEDFYLCEDAQKNLDIGIYSTGPLHPDRENGVIFYQTEVMKMALDHLEQETKAGHVIAPAFVNIPSATPTEVEENKNMLENGGSVLAY